MSHRFVNFYGPFSMFDDLRRRMDRLWEDFDQTWSEPGWPTTSLAASTWPAVNLFDAGTQLVVHADVPGIREQDLQLHLGGGNNTLSIAGERKAEVPEGYTVHRQERGAFQFARSFTLPCKIDPERITAKVKDGVLLVTLPKAPEAQPRQITVQSQ
ncbi:Hsp20/alpha crystallin family protein [Pendulispora albinea]|uniref:Hsp20/alpha crystallin family protein n=1 Tax=Pendulispora albinea TaxID=2741071 RepID=A0ABZ2LZ52_9BACT